MSPQRIQLRRTKGWRKPDGAIVVARPSKWGNWYVVVRARTAERAPGGGFKRNGPWLVVATDKRGWATGPHWGGFGDSRHAAAEFAVELYRRALEGTYDDLDGPLNHEFYMRDLRGHDLACWCPLDQPCHADVLLELANPPREAP